VLKDEFMTKSELKEFGTATRILDVAERLVQVRGFNGFSYSDVSSELKITKAALHYHFASKAELGVTLIERYSTRFVDALSAIDAQSTDAFDRLRGYADLYAQILRDRRMCLCGMMAAEYETLTPPMQAAVYRYFGENQKWLTHVLSLGKETGNLEFRGSPSEVASMILGAFEGAMLIARTVGDISGFESSVNHLLASLQPTTPV
jgi:TetR/AcrR family transcriptional regulator, transcriptional repressor for nem operon